MTNWMDLNKFIGNFCFDKFLSIMLSITVQFYFIPISHAKLKYDNGYKITSF